ncbi:MAG TPA: nicotinate (nicotinamide) nucleotide adenylyltransferase [Solirubrobacteraceae bacterium]|jgi:nicotinate-nucleotide adenylyltransferase
MAGARTIGILGGTFNPPHRGHLALARHAREKLGLGRVLLMPAHSAPHKGEDDDPGAERRLEMCRLAVGGEAGLEVCGLEVERGGPSYTVDTLRAIDASDPEAELTFILGADMARTLPAWREPRALVGLTRLAVAEREDTSCEDVLRALVPLGARVEFLGMPMFQVSSSIVRTRVRDGESIEGLVEPGVAEYIAAHGLYRAVPARSRASNQAQADPATRAKARTGAE